MECFNCKSFYNNTQNTPHLLTDCGHSICLQCLKLNYTNHTIICPECKVPNRKETMSMFPKNLALLYIKPPATNDKSVRASLQSEASTLNSQDSKGMCMKHNKKLELFCENDRQMLCVICMVYEGYKDKDISTIPEAAEKEKKLISKAVQLAQITENRCKMLQNGIMEGYSRLSSAADRAIQEVTTFFNEIRDVIAGRESNLKREIAEKQRREESLIKLKQESVTELMNNITSFYYDYKLTMKLDDISLLSGSAQRIELLKQMTAETGDFEFQVSFKELDRLKELNSIWNILSPLDERQTHEEHNRMRIAKNLSASSATVKSNDKSHSSVAQTHSKNKGAKASGVASSLRGTWGDKRGEKAVKNRVTNGLASPVVQVKESERAKRNSERQDMVFEKIAELDCDYKGETVSIAQIPYYSQDMKPNYAEKNLNSQVALGDSPFQRAGPSKSVSASVITINLNDNDEYMIKENVQPAYQDHPNLSDRDNWTLQTDRIKTPHYELYGRGLDGKPNETEIRRVETSHCSSFHTNGELLDLLNPGRDLDFSRRFDLKSIGGKMKGQYMQGQGQKGNVQNRSQVSLSKESFADYNKENVRGMNQQQNVSMSREFSKRNNLILPKDILESRTSYDNMIHERRQSEYHDTTMNWSTICQNINSYIYIMDGNGQNLQARVERLDMQRGYWEYGGAIPGNRSKFTAVVLPRSGNILMLGGKEKGARTANCEEYVLEQKTFRPSQVKLKCEKSGFGAVVMGDEIFICGGNTGKGILRSFESYNLSTNTWKVLAPLKQVREELGLVVGPDQRIYAVGGIGGPNGLPLNTVERYDPEKREWEYIAPMNVPRRALSVVSLPDGIYAIGGFDGHNYLSTVEKYDENMNEWVIVGSMNVARCRAAAVTSSDFRNIYIFGGENYEGLSSVERYSVINNKWEMMEQMRTARSMHTAVIVSK